MGGFSTLFLESCFHYMTFAALVLGGLGVIAAFIAGFSGYEVADRLQKEADEKISATNMRLEEAKATGETAKADAAKANESAAATNERANILEKNNLELQSTLEKERTARLQLEETVSPRRIAPNQKASLLSEFKSLSGRTVSVVSYTMDAESVSLGLELIEMLKEAKVNVIEGLLTQQPMSGIAVGLHTVGKDKALAHKLANAFGTKSNLTVTYNPESIPGFEVKMVLGGFDDSKAEATILIGPKPIPKAK